MYIYMYVCIFYISGQASFSMPIVFNMSEMGGFSVIKKLFHQWERIDFKRELKVLLSKNILPCMLYSEFIFKCYI